MMPARAALVLCRYLDCLCCVCGPPLFCYYYPHLLLCLAAPYVRPLVALVVLGSCVSGCCWLSWSYFDSLWLWFVSMCVGWFMVMVGGVGLSSPADVMDICSICYIGTDLAVASLEAQEPCMSVVR